MKKFLVVLLSLGLIVAFGATASATDVKFGGSYYVVGLYDSNQLGADTDAAYSRAFFYQRIRIQPVFQIAQGLTFTARMDAMEKQWGQTDWRGGVDDKNSSRRQNQSVGNPKIQESFEWERGYVGFMTAIGLVQAGYMSSGKWGTNYGDDEQSRPRARIDGKIGPINWGFVYEKEFDSDTSSQTYTITKEAGPYSLDTGTGKIVPTTAAKNGTYSGNINADNTTYAPYVIYNWKGGSAGLLYKYFDRAASRPTVGASRAKFHALLPMFKATFGPVYMEGEVVYMFGKAAAFDNPPAGVQDVDIKGLGAYLKAQANMGPAYFGGHVLYSQGDDDPTDTTAKTSPSSQDLDFGLILGNDALQTWEATGGNGGANGTTFDSGKQNAIMYGFFGGFKVSPKLTLDAMLVFAKRDKVPANVVSKNMGYEFDMTAKYKIYDNLTYMVGAGYLWTGDYFKGTNSANKVGNDYLLLNRLSLSF